MNFRFASLSVFICLTFLSMAQAPNFDWVNSIGGKDFELSNNLTLTDSSEIIIVGAFNGTTDFDPDTTKNEITSQGNSDVFIQKYSTDGKLKWVKTVGGAFFDEAYDVTTDPDQNIYVTGSFANTADFDPSSNKSNLSSKGGRDIYILKLDKNGNYLWARSIGGSGDDEGLSLVADATGVYVTGFFSSTVDFIPGNGTLYKTAVGEDDYFMLKLNQNGNFKWVNVIGSANVDRGGDVTFDKNHDLVVTGYFYGFVDFDPGSSTTTLASKGAQDCFIQKLDTSGKFIWAKSVGGKAFDTGVSIDVDSSNNVYVTGWFLDSADFDPGFNRKYLKSLGSTEVFLLKLDDDGDYVWASRIGGVSNEYPTSVTISPKQEIYLSGYYSGAIDADPGTGLNVLTSKGSFDNFIVKLDLNGKLKWAESFGGTSQDQIRGALAVDEFNAMYFSGFYQGKCDFAPNIIDFSITAIDFFEAFVCKWNQCEPTYAVDVHTACDTFTWIDGITYDSSTQDAFFKLKNVACCDSIVNLHLTINHSVSRTDSVIACNDFKWVDGKTYTTNNYSAQQTYKTSNGCDSVILLALTIDSLEVGITQNANELKAVELNAKYQWFDCKNNIEIAGEESRTYTPSTNGEYAVIVIGSRCEDTSTCVVMNTIWVEEVHQLAFNVYPNPSDGSFTIKSNAQHQKPIKANIISIEGRVVWEGIIKNDKQTIQLDPIPGVYVLEVLDEGIAKRSKLIIR